MGLSDGGKSPADPGGLWIEECLVRLNVGYGSFFIDFGREVGNEDVKVLGGCLRHSICFF